MISPIILFKFLMTPLIIAGVSLVARRWGNDIGGMLIGLPLTSGPVSVFFTLEQGRQFASSAANTAIVGTIPVVIFYLVYMFSARNLKWYFSTIVSLAAYFISLLIFSYVTPSALVTAFLVPLELGIAYLVLGKPEKTLAEMPDPWWNIPMRIFTATALVVIITTTASHLGPLWSGLLSAFPIFSVVMSTFSHSQGGLAALKPYFRGAILGLYSYYSFFMVVNVLITRANITLVYILATMAALVLNLLFFRFRSIQMRKTKSLQVEHDVQVGEVI
jgi:hypothetical protein